MIAMDADYCPYPGPERRCEWYGTSAEHEHVAHLIIRFWGHHLWLQMRGRTRRSRGVGDTNKESKEGENF